MFEIREFNVEVQQHVEMKLSHSPQALAWGKWRTNHRTVLTVYVETANVLHDYDKPLKRFNSLLLLRGPQAKAWAE